MIYRDAYWRAALFRLRTLRRTNLSTWALMALFGSLLLWIWIALDIIVTSSGPDGAVIGIDFSHTYSAVYALSAGRNPYDYHVLTHTQHAIMSQSGIPAQVASPAVLVGTSAFYLWALQPLVALPYQVAAVAWMATSFVLVGAVFLLLLRHFGWRRRWLPALVFLGTPAVVLGTAYGNMSDLSFAAVAGALPLLRRYPVLAGVVLSMGLLKLPIVIPLAGLIILFQAPHKLRTVSGLVLAFLSRHLLATLLLGATYQHWWLESLMNFSSTQQLQPNMSSFSGLYSGLLPHPARLAVEFASVVIAAAVTLAFWYRVREQPIVSLRQTGWLWFLWILATPYAHFVDEIVLVIPVLALLGRDGANLRHPRSITVLSLLGLSILLFSWTPFHMQLLWLPLALCMVCLRGPACSPQLETAEAHEQVDGFRHQGLSPRSSVPAFASPAGQISS